MNQNCPVCGNEMERIRFHMQSADTELNKLESVREYFALVDKTLKDHFINWICRIDGTIVQIERT